MNREFLKGLELTDEQIETIMKEHGKAVQSAKPEDYDDLKTAKQTLEQQLNDLTQTNSALNEKQSDFESQINELQSKTSEYERTNNQYRIASQIGIPLELAGRIQGETEDEMKVDAENLVSFMAKPEVAPLKSSEPQIVDPETSAYAALVQNLKTEGE